MWLGGLIGCDGGEEALEEVEEVEELSSDSDDEEDEEDEEESDSVDSDAVLLDDGLAGLGGGRTGTETTRRERVPGVPSRSLIFRLFKVFSSDLDAIDFLLFVSEGFVGDLDFAVELEATKPTLKSTMFFSSTFMLMGIAHTKSHHPPR